MSASEDKVEKLQRQKIRRGIIYRELAVPDRLADVRKAFIMPIPRATLGPFSKPKGNRAPRTILQSIGAPGKFF